MVSAAASSSLLSYQEAAAVVDAYTSGLTGNPLHSERVSLANAWGRVLAQDLRADRDQPPFTRSTRDGYACRAREASAHGFLARAGASRAGDAPAGPLAAGAAWEIMTGAPVPEGADCVVMVEHVETVDGKVRLLPPRSIQPGDNLVPLGAQARAGDEILARGSTIHAQQIALAATCGYPELEVYKRPRVAILATGDELVPVEAKPTGGQIRNSNAPMLASMVTAAGGEPLVLARAADHAEALDAALALARDADLLLISGGVSAGKFDLVEPALARLGASFHFTGVKIQPGKPLVFGELPAEKGNAKRCAQLPFFGLPGNPVSSAVTFLLFGAPVVAALGGSTSSCPRFALARLKVASDKHGKPGLTRFLPAHCTFDAEPEVELVPWQGSGDLAALARSNCFLVVPSDAHRLEAGAVVRILLAS